MNTNTKSFCQPLFHDWKTYLCSDTSFFRFSSSMQQMDEFAHLSTTSSSSSSIFVLFGNGMFDLTKNQPKMLHIHKKHDVIIEAAYRCRGQSPALLPGLQTYSIWTEIILTETYLNKDIAHPEHSLHYTSSHELYQLDANRHITIPRVNEDGK